MLLCNDLFTVLVLRRPGTLKAEKNFWLKRKRPPESGFSEAFYQSVFTSELPQTTPLSHRRTLATGAVP
jgi:hypothetical protein